MAPAGSSTTVWVVSLVPYALLCAGVIIAVVGKAVGRCPYQPDEFKAFTWPQLPRMHSKIYQVRLNPPRRRGAPTTKKGYENINQERPGRDGG